jgi:hypothetical protein
VRPGPRAALAAAALACVILAGVAFGAGPDQAREAPSDGAGPSAIDARYQQVLDTGHRLERINTELRRNRETGTRLAQRVETLKKSSSGVMRDAQLQDALRDLRGAIAEERSLKAKAATLSIGLGTQRLELARAAGTMADGLMADGDRRVRGNDLEGARHRFESAYDLLTLPVAVPPDTAPTPAERPDPNVDVRPRGDETPDELRVLALILRDGAERMAYNAQLWNGLLARLKAERQTVAALLDLAPPPSEARADVLARLDARIEEVQGEIGGRARAQGGLLARAVFLEQTARLNEFTMLKDATLNPAPETPQAAPEGTP